MLNVTPKLIAEAKELAKDNYESWGQYIVECYEDSELAEIVAELVKLNMCVIAELKGTKWSIEVTK